MYFIFTDSLNAITCIRSYHNKKQHPVGNNIIRDLSVSNCKIAIAWIPGHVGIVGNSLADTAAKEGALLFPVPAIAVPFSDLKTFVKSSINRKMQQDWSNIETTNKLRSIRDSVAPWTTSKNSSRRLEVSLCRLRIGHTLLTHGYLFNRLPPPLCSVCSVPLTVEHLLVHCPNYTKARQLSQIPNTVSKILCNDISSVNLLTKFLELSQLSSLL